VEKTKEKLYILREYFISISTFNEQLNNNYHCFL